MNTGGRWRRCWIFAPIIQMIYSKLLIAGSIRGQLCSGFPETVNIDENTILVDKTQRRHVSSLGILGEWLNWQWRKLNIRIRINIKCNNILASFRMVTFLMSYLYIQAFASEIFIMLFFPMLHYIWWEFFEH